MDLSVVCRFFPRWGESDLTFGVYNTTDRRNPYFIFLQPTLQRIGEGPASIEVPTGIRARQVSLFPILPSVTWNFKF